MKIPFSHAETMSPWQEPSPTRVTWIIEQPDRQKKRQVLKPETSCRRASACAPNSSLLVFRHEAKLGLWRLGIYG